MFLRRYLTNLKKFRMSSHIAGRNKNKHLKSKLRTRLRSQKRSLHGALPFFVGSLSMNDPFFCRNSLRTCALYFPIRHSDSQHHECTHMCPQPKATSYTYAQSAFEGRERKGQLVRDSEKKGKANRKRFGRQSSPCPLALLSHSRSGQSLFVTRQNKLLSRGPPRRSKLLQGIYCILDHFSGVHSFSLKQCAYSECIARAGHCTELQIACACIGQKLSEEGFGLELRKMHNHRVRSENESRNNSVSSLQQGKEEPQEMEAKLCLSLSHLFSPLCYASAMHFTA